MLFLVLPLKGVLLEVGWNWVQLLAACLLDYVLTIYCLVVCLTAGHDLESSRGSGCYYMQIAYDVLLALLGLVLLLAPVCSCLFAGSGWLAWASLLVVAGLCVHIKLIQLWVGYGTRLGEGFPAC
jgi:hypothetical protein